MTNKEKGWKTFENRPRSQKTRTIALEVFNLLSKNPLIFLKENQRKTNESIGVT